MDFEQFAIQAAKEDLLKFCLVYDKNYTVNWHHREIARALQKVEEGKIKRLIIEMPPRHGKSQLASIYFPAWYLGRNPTQEIITCSYAAELATDFGSKTRDVLADEQYHRLFATRLKEDSKSKNKWKTNDGGSYTSVGFGGPITGRGANILLIDDPLKNREEAESKVIRDKVWDWYRSTAYTRLEKGGSVVIIMTRWHMDDLVGRLLDQMDKGGDKWTRIRFPAVATEDEVYRKNEEALWPDKYDLEQLDSIKVNIGIYDWSALYQQNPIAHENQEFKKQWFQYFTDEDLVGKEMYYYSMVDVAGDKENADDNTIVTIAKAADSPNIYIVDILAGIMNPGDVVNYLFTIKAKYGHRHVRFGIESVGYQRTLEYWVREEQRKREQYFDIIELKAKSKKETRIRGLKPMYQAGVIFHRQVNTDAGTLKLEEQLLTFPRGIKDDVVDCLAYAPQILKNTVLRNARVVKPNWGGSYKLKERQYGFNRRAKNKK